MTNTIPNVPRELLERLALQRKQDGWLEMNTAAAFAAAKELRVLLDATPSPAGVDGLEVVGYLTPYALEVDMQQPDDEPLCRLSGAQAIIDGLRGEVERVTGLWELELARAQKAENELAHAVLTIDQQAKRIGELEGLLDRVKVSLSLDDTEWGYSAPEKYKLLADIRAALSAGKEGE